MGYTARYDFFDGTSGNSSAYTSASYLVADFNQFALSWDTDTTTASRMTLQGSNDDGTTSSIGTWSNITGITAAGIYVVDTGVRWVRALRNSNESLARVRVQAKQLR